MSSSFARVAALAVGTLALAGCEDNPDQFFTTAPKGAGLLWNDGQTAPYSDAARNSFNDNFGGASKDSLCDAPTKHNVWSKMVNQPIIPSSKNGLMLGGINMDGNNWSGLNFHDAQAALCQANPEGVNATELEATWGDSKEIDVTYLINNNIVDSFTLNQGYRGTLDFASRPHALGSDTAPNPFGNHKYSIGVGTQILKDGATMALDWGNGGANIAKQATELFDAIMYTFAPEMKSTQGNCVLEQSCLGEGVGGGAAAFGVRPLGIYFQVPNMTVQPQASTPQFIYGFPVKLMPFSSAAMFLKLDADGPTATTTGLGDKQDKTCVQKLGLTYGEFLDTCVNVTSDAATNAGVLQKLFGGFAHDKETYNFTVQGVDTDFASTKIGDSLIVGDTWKPDPADPTYHFNLDVRATGTMLNEYAEDGTTFTFGATGAIYREFARRVEADIQVQQAAFDPTYKTLQGGTPFDIGDQRCVITASSDMSKWNNPAPNASDPNGGYGWTNGCTGFEQFVTPAEHTTSTVSVGTRSMSLGGPRAQGMGFKSALKPGDPIATFCADPAPIANTDGAEAGASCTQNSDCWSNSCSPVPATANAAPADGTAPAAGAMQCDDVSATYFQHCGANDNIGSTGALYTTAYSRVIQYLGHGNPLRVAPALRDPKYYLQQFGYAMVKYLMTAGLSPRPTDLNLPQYGPTGTACAGKTCEPNMDHLQFDQNTPGSDSMTMSYIDRRWVEDGKDPISFQYQVLVNSSNQQETRFRQHLDRDEHAIFTAMQTDKTKALLDESNNLRLTNIIGSPIISARWSAASPTKSAYYCATNLDSDCTAVSPANKPPMIGSTIELDDDGNPLMTNYKGAFTGTPFALDTAYMKIVAKQPENEAAQVQMPNFADPYNVQTGGNTATPGVKTMPDWRPLAPGAGFPIPVNGERDRFRPAAALNFSGQNLSVNFDYDEQADGSVSIVAAEAATFEGEVFLCDDPITNEILHVRQFDSVADVQQWIYNHPGTQDACDLFIRVTPVGDGQAPGEPAQILAKGAGVTATVAQGSGVGRVVDVILYDTAQ